MRLATIDVGGTTRAAALTDAGATLIQDEHGTPFADVGALLRADEGISRARAALETGEARPFDPRELRCPVLSPGAVVCVGLNYRRHILEMGRELPREPTLFSKLPRALLAPYADIGVLAAGAKALDYEGEVAVVIGRAGRSIDPADAWSHVAGLMVFNDITMRDFQRRSVQWFAGKTWQASSPAGPWLTTTDAVPDPSELQLTTLVNGERRQHASLDELVFDVPRLVADVSTLFGLEPGDILATGTPGGVGEATGELLADGDEVRVEVSGLGAVSNVVRVL